MWTVSNFISTCCLQSNTLSLIYDGVTTDESQHDKLTVGPKSLGQV